MIILPYFRNCWTVLFGKNSLDRNHALKAVFPALWSSVWNTGWNRCHENMRHDHERDIADKDAELSALRAQVSIRHSNGRFMKKVASNG
ncbi:MAG: hypothetical protein QM647_13110 [Asticcacaulis sp.]|uniref:hypothetical protein n=1 Tax=Asticcacaulis sp. TaxID=1872648 RepID=UPI0039E537DC